jgi:phage head maturation protease
MDTAHLFLSPDIRCEASASGDDDLPARFSGVAYSGGIIPQFGPFGDAAIDLATLQASDRIFALVNHDPDQRAGHGRVWVENNQLLIEGQFARATEAGRQLAAEFRDGAPWQLSVGLQFQKQRPASPLDINGQTLAVKTLFTNATVREVSFVPVGADPHTSVAAFAATDADDFDNATEAQMSAELEAKIADLQSQLSAAQAELSAEKAQREAAESQIQEIQAAARLEAVKSLFVELGREFSDAAAQPYLGLPDSAFALLSADLRAVKPTLDPALTRQQATSGQAGPDIAQLSAKLLAQVAGKKE